MLRGDVTESLGTLACCLLEFMMVQQQHSATTAAFTQVRVQSLPVHASRCSRRAPCPSYPAAAALLTPLPHVQHVPRGPEGVEGGQLDAQAGHGDEAVVEGEAHDLGGGGRWGVWGCKGVTRREMGCVGHKGRGAR